MSFARAYLVVLAFAPLVWAFFEWRRAARKSGLLLKAFSLAAVILALAEPRVSVQQTRMAVAVLVDTSASVTSADLEKASALATEIQDARGRHWVKIIPFARSSRVADQTERTRGWNLRHTGGEAGNATDMEAALREGLASLPGGLVPRLVLISDGRENKGSVARGAWQARSLGVPIDTFALPGRSRPALRLESVSMPALAFTGDKFPVNISLISPERDELSIEIQAEGKTLGQSTVAVEPGLNQIRVHASVSIAGATEVAGSIRSGKAGEVGFAQAITLRRPRVLYVSQDPEGTEVHLLRTLSAGFFEVDQASGLGGFKLADYQVVVLNNQDLAAIPATVKDDLAFYVKEGGGLLVIGGERNIYAENKKTEDPLEQSLPAKVAPPKSPEGTCVVLILDKSSSMEGRKMELARLAAIGVIENLRPFDRIGVLIFDNSFQWVVPIRKAEDRSLIKRMVAGVMPDGGTQIAPALAEAFRRILPATATYKHVVLLTDGISEEGDSLTVAREAAQQKVTISTVGLGQDVNRAYLEKVAVASKGRSYFLTDPSGLEQILLRDVMEHTGSTAIEKPIVPVVLKKAEILNGVGIETAPPLKGYVKFEAKPTAETILAIERKDPLLVRWQYGLGRAAVFTSDAKGRWAEKWVTWNGYDRFWQNLLRDLLPHSQAGEAAVEFDSADGELVVDYRLGRSVEEPPRPPDIYVFGANGFQRPVEVRKVAQGAYRGKLPIAGRQGLFRIRPLAETRAFPEVGFYRQEQELSDYGADELLLKGLADYTGGRFNPATREVFDSGGRSVPGATALWPGLLAIAILLNVIELTLRKWKGVIEGLRAETETRS